MTKAIYLVKAKGYCYIFPDGKKSIYNETINYHCCTSLEEAKEDIRRWKKEEKQENKTRKEKGIMQIRHNFQIETLSLFEH